MRRLLISTAAFVLLASPALAQPIGKASVAPEVQQRAQQELQRQQAAPQQQRPQQAAPQDRNRDAGRDYRRDGNRDANRDGRDYRRDGDRRPGYSGPRRDYSSFRDYRRSYNSSRRFRGPAYHRPPGWYDRRWTFGEFLPSLFWSSSYWLDDFNRYDLPPPPYGTVWVRNGRDALLIDRDSGEIISVRYAVFY